MPSSLTFAEQLETPPMLNQKPLAMPRPRFLPSKVDFQWSLFFAALRHRSGPPADKPARPPAAFLLSPRSSAGTRSGQFRVSPPARRSPVPSQTRRASSRVRDTPVSAACCSRRHSLHPCVRKVITAENTHAPWTNHPTGKTTAVVSHPGVTGDERAVFLRAELHRMNEPGVGPVPSKTSLRCMAIFTGLPHFRLSNAATGSR